MHERSHTGDACCVRRVTIMCNMNRVIFESVSSIFFAISKPLASKIIDTPSEKLQIFWIVRWVSLNACSFCSVLETYSGGEAASLHLFLVDIALRVFFPGI